MLTPPPLDFPLWLLPLLSFSISFFTSMAGVSGAFLLLPFQVSILGLNTPAVSATNFLYNIIGCPGGIGRFVKEKRMIWPLAWLISLTTLPGILIGYYLRVHLFPDPSLFKLFVGMVLLYLGTRLLRTAICHRDQKTKQGPGHFAIRDIRLHPSHLSYRFQDQSFSVPHLSLGAYCLVIGVIGGIYGIGGGALIVPFCVSVLGLPIYTVAGATLFGTFIASISGVLFYTLVPMGHGQTFPPHWLVGVLLGLGGLLGMNAGALAQKYMPERSIKGILALILLVIASKYILNYFI